MEKMNLLAQSELVSGREVRDLLKEIMESSQPIHWLDVLMASDLMKVWLPELVALNGEKGEQDPEFHPEGNAWVHSKIVLSNMLGHGHDWVLLLGALLHDVGKAPSQSREKDGRIRNPEHAEVGAVMVREIGRRLEMEEADIDRMSELARLHMKMHKVDKIRPGRLDELLKHRFIMDLIALQHADSMPAIHPWKSRKNFLLAKLQEKAEAQVAKSSKPKAIVDGSLLISLGFMPGPSFKAMLAAAVEAEASDAFADRDGAVAWIRANLAA